MKSIKLLMDSPPLSESNYTSKSFLSLREVIVPRISTEFNGHTNCHKNAMIITSRTKFAHVNKQNLTFIESIIEDSNVTSYHKYAKTSHDYVNSLPLVLPLPSQREQTIVVVNSRRTFVMLMYFHPCSLLCIVLLVSNKQSWRTLIGNSVIVIPV